MLATLEAGTEVELLDRQGVWFLIRPLDGGQYPWRQGWIHRQGLDALGPTAADRQRPTGPPPPPLSVRGFAQVGGIFFTAADSFRAVLDNPRGILFGGGGQVVLGNGLYVQAEIERTEKTGDRALVVNEKLFQLDAPNTTTVTPILFTVGGRAIGAGRTTPYVGAGVGWYHLEETSSLAPSSQNIDEHHVGYHVVGGAEYRFASLLTFAGEIQWASVPGALGESGVSRILDETDLGGTTFRFRVLVGK